VPLNLVEHTIQPLAPLGDVTAHVPETPECIGCLARQFRCFVDGPRQRCPEVVVLYVQVIEPLLLMFTDQVLLRLVRHRLELLGLR